MTLIEGLTYQQRMLFLGSSTERRQTLSVISGPAVPKDCGAVSFITQSGVRQSQEV